MTSAPSSRIVPVEPTEAMIEGGRTVLREYQGPLTLGTVLDIYRAMLSAAPVLPAPTKWRSIDSAPKDGTWIIVRTRLSHFVYRVSWGVSHSGDPAWCSQTGAFLTDAFDAWIPDPPAPLVQKGKESGE